MSLRLLRAVVFAAIFPALPAFAAAPSATTSAATSITTSSAVLNGAGAPNGQATTGWFRISASNPGTCSDTFGTRVPAAGGTDLGSGASSVPYSITATGLSAGVTYYFCAIVSNGSGTAFGSVLSFFVPSTPAVTTLTPPVIGSAGATLEGTASPGGSSTTGYFRYATTNPGTCNDTFGTRAPTSGGSNLGAGTSPVDYTLAIAGLTPGATYYYCALASNAYGTSFGAVISFTTQLIAPVVTTNNASLVTGATAQLNGAANPGGGSTTGWFRYSTTNPGACNDTFGTRAPTSGGTLLGSGNSAVSFSVGITGLSAATTYYFCALAANSVATSLGSVLSFTTPSAPTVTTSAASSISNTSAFLNGSGNPQGASATGYFRYSLTSPGTCNDSFGSRAPAAGGSGLGSGTSAQAYSQSISGLSAGTTYYYCAIASNSEGTGFGAVLSFTTSSAPATTTWAATVVTATSATLNGSANPNGNSASGFFRYSTTYPGSCNDTFGTRLPSSSYNDASLGSGTSAVAFAQAVTGLTPATTYYFCALGYNSYGTSFGSVLSFTTPAALPAVSTSSASLLTGTTATLNGSANPGGASATGWFRYATASPGSCNDSFGTRAPTTGGSALGSGNSAVGFSQAIGGLTAGTTYYVCAIAQNAVGLAVGSVVSFTTPTPPSVTTAAASSIGNTTAYLNGSANPHGSATTGYFRYSTTNPGTCDDTFGSRAPTSGGSSLGSGNSDVGFSQSITGLSSGVTYYFCAIANSAEGTAFGAVLSFTTTGAPLVTTSPATLVTATSATLNGSANPNGDSAYGYFRYSTTNPGSCNDSFGTRLPSSSYSDTYLGSGTSAVAFLVGISLTPATTYYFCALSRNSYGTSFGSVLSFTTLAALPAVTTNSPSLLTGTTATLNGSANPGGAATTAWFRYATTSPGSCNDTFGTRAPLAGGSALGSGTATVSFSQAIAGLTAGTTYYVCAIAQNSVGMSLGSVVTFATPTPPTVTTSAASSIGNTSAYLNGSANPHGSSTTGYFRYSATNPGSCDDTFGSRAPTTGGSNLGSGNSNQSFSQSVSGLSSGVTYYYCAIANSFEGTAFGAVLSFTTTGTPLVATSAATLVTATSATLNGSASPNGDSAYGYFRYSITDPGSCNDSFGTRLPSSSSYDIYLGSGTSAVAFSQAVTSLTPATTYYFCALGRNSYGTSFGAVLTFTTPAALPAVITNSPSLLTGTTATLNGSANPGGASTTGWFRFATTSPGSCNDTFGTRAPLAGGSAVGSGTATVSFSQAIAGLTAGTTYYVCAIVQNSVGMSLGSVVAFATPTPPTVTTSAASSIGNTSASLNGSANPHGSSTTGYFRYSATDPGTCDDTFGSRAPTAGGSSLGSGSSNQSYSQSISGLSSGVTYYYCAIATSSEGTGFGAVLSFTTSSAPSVTTSAATLVTATSATLNGSADPNGDSAYGYYRYSTAHPGSCNDSFGTRLPSNSYYDSALGSGTSSVAFAQSLTGLTPGTTYYFCALGRNSYGTSFGAVLSFATPAALPVVTTNTPSTLTGTTAQLSGWANPGGAATTGWFRYATVSPGTCNDTFGTRAPTTGGSSLGSGTAGTTFSQAITGLTAGNTYYVCAIAQNSVGLGFGAVVTFTTPTPPTAVTSVASSIGDTAAYLNGSGNPHGASTTGYFRFGLTDPGTCDDLFGSRAPTTGGTSLGSGNSDVGFSQYISGLTSGVTYYYCAITTSTEGTAYGAVVPFTTASAPVVTTSAATSVTSNSATLNGSAFPDGDSSYGYFRYSTTNPVVCNDAFGTRVPSSSYSDAALGSGTSSVAFSQAISGLTPGTTYYVCALGRNYYGTSFGAVLSFTTTTTAPTVTTTSATAVGTTGATLNGSANPNGANSTGWFRFATASPGTCNDTFGTRMPATGGSSLGAGTTTSTYSQTATGLTPGTTYFFCAIASNSVGKAFGSVLSFTTTKPPTVTTLAATPVTGTTATLNASVNPNGYATTGWFRYSTTNPGSCDNTFGAATGTSSLGSGTSLVALMQPLSGLSPASTYYFCAIGQSSIGTSFGALLSFTTPAAPPSVTAVAASDITDVSATLNASANPNGSATTAWFRYSTSNPGSCNDTFGTRLPATGGVDLGPGNSPVPFTQPLAGLIPGTTYYFCALASSPIGNSVGTVLSFTTATVPVVTTAAATLVTPTAATLNGSANPNQAETTAWFRLSTTDPGACNDTFGTRAPLTGGSSLGAGSSAVPFSQAITGLSGATTYYYCAIAQNAAGTSFGSVGSFTAPAPPTTTTLAATGVTASGATVNGTANPNLLAATGWFRYSMTNPGTCDDTFGTRTPSSGGSALGSGSTPQSFSQTLTGLLSVTTYYVCAIAQNSVGTAFGSVLSFTTAGPPSVTTVSAASVTASGATVNGSAIPNGLASTGWFRFSTSSPGTCNDTFGTRAPASGGTALGSGSTDAPYAQSLSGLAAGTTYYYCAIASNASGTRFGAVLTFTTLSPPAVTSAAATAIDGHGATLNGSADPRGNATSGWFRYATASPGSCNDTFGIRAPASGGTNLGSGTGAAAYSEVLATLIPGTTYYFCAIASNAVGTSFGSVLSFLTPDAPLATTSAASAVTSSGAALNGSGNPRGASATGWFRFALTDPGTCNDAFGTRLPSSGGSSLGAGSTAASYSQSAAGLAAATTYYYCAIVQSSEGTAFGSVMSFRTLAAPIVTTEAATLVADTTATLNGTANPNGAAATGWFRYSTTNPSICNDTFGTRTPSTGGASLGSGTTSSPFAQAITGLTAGTVYYYCALAQNSVGTTLGAVQSFATTGAPVVTTAAAAGVTGSGATLNGSANPSGQTTTGYFRYATSSPGTCNDSFGTRAPTTGGTNLGSGSSSLAYSQTITGLATSTTYYFCAIASNASGTRFGAVMSFTTLSPPAVTSAAATAIDGHGATLNGSADPKGDATAGWFRYSTTSPGSCNDTFGIRAPASGGTDLGSGTAPAAYSQVLTGLTSGTTYYFCAIAANSVGTSFGGVLSLQTPDAPLTTTSAASAVTSTGATLNGSGNPRGASATGWFRYATTDPGTCNDSFGTRAPASGGWSLGAGTTSASFSQAVSGLVPGTTYYFCAIASNVVGTAVGTVLSFSTPALPTVTSSPATAITGTGATLNGLAVPNGAVATGYFRYSATNPTTCNDTFGTRAPTTGGTSLGAGNSAASYSQTLASLTPGTTYYFCALASNAVGVGLGDVLSFTTPAAPAVTTAAAIGVSGTGATLNGSAIPGGAATTAYFRYSTTNPGATCNDAFGTRTPAGSDADLGSGSIAVDFSQTLTGLAEGTTYWYCAIATNAVGTRFGAVLSFQTLARPTIATAPATGITGSGATLNGAATANGSAATGWFRYASANPGSCSDTFGVRAPISGATNLGSGSTSVPFLQAVTGLSSGTTYFYCAIARNTAGLAFGELQSFTTPAAPAVTSLAATSVGGTAATLNGSATPNGAATTGYFRYGTTNPGVCDDLFGTRAPASGGTNLGSGSATASYAAMVTGLATGTTYYFCAAAVNSEGARFGNVLTFNTLTEPAVTTLAASGVTSTEATLHGWANPNGTATLGWFRYSPTDPGSCNDTFGTRAPAAGGSDLGSGAAAAFTQALAGLTPGTQYYCCAIAQNAVGKGYGSVMSFTAAAVPPAVTTAAATLVTGTSATFNGAANPGGAAATGYFRYSTTSPSTCDDSFGMRAPTSDGVALGAGNASVPFSQPVTGLTPGRTYFVCALAQSSAGTGVGSVRSFTTPDRPAVSTMEATEVTATAAVLNGRGNPRLADTKAWFRFDTANPGACSDSFGTRVPATDGVSLGAGAAETDFAQDLTELAPGTTYYFCALAQNAQGTALGEVLSFRTPGVPVAVTSSASNVTSGSAILNGSGLPNGADAIGYFRWSTTAPPACDDTFGARLPASGGVALGTGTAAVPYAEPLAGLAPGATVYFCAIAQNPLGTGFGQLLSFQATAPVPLVQTLDAADVGDAGATLWGSAVPNGTTAIGWFRYSETRPEACSDSFGVRVPAQAGIALGAGPDAVPFSAALTDLRPNRTYFFCAIASNTGGAAFGGVREFSTTSIAPTVSTQEATMDGGATTLQGTVNPHGADSLGWFQIDATQPTHCDESFGRQVPTEGVVLGAGYDDVPLVAPVTDLAPGTYYFCAAASSKAGTSYGEPMTVVIPAPPATQGCGCSSGEGSALSAVGLVLVALALLGRRRRPA